MLTDRDYELLSAYLDDALTADERSSFEARLQADAELRRELASLRATVALLRDLPTLRAPRDFTLTPAMVRPPRLLIFPATAWTSLASAAAAFVFIALGLLLLTSNQTRTPLPAMQNQVAAAPTQPVTLDALPAPTQTAPLMLPGGAFGGAAPSAADEAAPANGAAESQLSQPAQPPAATFLPGTDAEQTQPETAARSAEPEMFAAEADTLDPTMTALAYAAPSSAGGQPTAEALLEMAEEAESDAPLDDAASLMMQPAPTATASSTPAPTASNTPTRTPTTVPSATPSLTPTVTATATPTPFFVLPQNVDTTAVVGIILLIAGAAALLLAVVSVIVRRR